MTENIVPVDESFAAPEWSIHKRGYAYREVSTPVYANRKVRRYSAEAFKRRHKKLARALERSIRESDQLDKS